MTATVTVVTAAELREEWSAESPIDAIVMGDDNSADFAGRALVGDEITVLLAVATDVDTVEEEATWTTRAASAGF